MNSLKNIVVLDGYTLNPGDLSWNSLSALGKVEHYERTAPELIISRCVDAEVVFTNKTPLTANTLKQLPNLKYIGVLATGTNVVDIEAATAMGIVVTNVPAYGPDAVAQMVFAHILHYTQQVSAHDQAVQAGQWCKSDDFCFTLRPLHSLKGKVLGLIGYGDIGKQVASIGLAFGMQVNVNTRTPITSLPANAKWVELDEVFKSADFLSLHCPLSAVTEKLINAEKLHMMKSSAVLINTARGGLIDEQALADSLTQGQIAFAGLDVLSAEPPAAENPLLNLDKAQACRLSISPHIAWATKEARQNLLNIAVNNLKQFLMGHRVNQVN